VYSRNADYVKKVISGKIARSSVTAAVTLRPAFDCKGRLFIGSVAANQEILDVIFWPLQTLLLKYFCQAFFQCLTTIGSFSVTRNLRNVGMLVRQCPRHITAGKRMSDSVAKSVEELREVLLK
jgi:hypothetical protein